jgi:hypothetical protein
VRDHQPNPGFLWGDWLALAVGAMLVVYAAVLASDLSEADRRAAERSFWAAILIIGAGVGAYTIYRIRLGSWVGSDERRRGRVALGAGLLVPLAAGGGLLLAQASGPLVYWVLGAIAGSLLWTEAAHFILLRATRVENRQDQEKRHRS